MCQHTSQLADDGADSQCGPQHSSQAEEEPCPKRDHISDSDAYCQFEFEDSAYRTLQPVQPSTNTPKITPQLFTALLTSWMNSDDQVPAAGTSVFFNRRVPTLPLEKYVAR